MRQLSNYIAYKRMKNGYDSLGSGADHQIKTKRRHPVSKASREWKRYSKYSKRHSGYTVKSLSLTKYRQRRRHSIRTKTRRIVPYWYSKYRKAGVLPQTEEVFGNRLNGWWFLGEAHDNRFWPDEPIVLGNTVVSTWEHVYGSSEAWLWDSYKILKSPLHDEDYDFRYIAYTNYTGMNQCLGAYRDLANAQRRCERDFRTRRNEDEVQ